MSHDNSFTGISRPVEKAFRAAFETLLITKIKTINSFRQISVKDRKESFKTLSYTSTAFLEYQ